MSNDALPGTDLAVIEYPGADEGAPDDDEAPEAIEGEAEDGDYTDADPAQVLAPYEFRARLKGAVPIKRDKEGLVSLEVTFVIWSTAGDAWEASGPILQLIGENDPSMVFDVLVTPTMKQGRLV